MTQEYDIKHIEWTIRLLNWTNRFARSVISLALVFATGLLTVAFFRDVWLAFSQTTHPFLAGFVHAIGVLLLLWTMVELINTELGILQGDRVDVSVFIEVALVVIIRELILLPFKDVHPTWIDLGMWSGAAVLVGLTYFLIKQGQCKRLYIEDRNDPNER